MKKDDTPAKKAKNRRYEDPRPPVTACVRGDARDEETYRQVLGGERAALLFTDPPIAS